MSSGEDHRLRLTGGPESPSLARRAVGRWLGSLLDADRLHDAKLLVTELVSNGMRHAPAGALDLHVAQTGDRVRVEVADAGGQLTKATPTVPPPDAVGGRGLLMVDRLALDWGTAHNGRTTVWFELAAA